MSLIGSPSSQSPPPRLWRLGEVLVDLEQVSAVQLKPGEHGPTDQVHYVCAGVMLHCPEQCVADFAAAWERWLAYRMSIALGRKP